MRLCQVPALGDGMCFKVLPCHQTRDTRDVGTPGILLHLAGGVQAVQGLALGQHNRGAPAEGDEKQR